MVFRSAAHGPTVRTFLIGPSTLSVSPSGMVGTGRDVGPVNDAITSSPTPSSVSGLVAHNYERPQRAETLTRHANNRLLARSP
jgi:hypothetical protein